MRIGQVSETPPIDEFILKVASRCNINCDYCYEYNLGDQSWRHLPAFMSSDVAKLLSTRIIEHANYHRLSVVSISLHGGEPLLLGREKLENIFDIIHSTFCATGLKVNYSLQTNGILLDDSIVEIFKKFDVKIGISLDGNSHHNDIHRLTKSGKSTFIRSQNGIRLLAERAPELFAGILAVVDLKNDPIEVVDHLYELKARNIDLLLPHHNWERQPWRRNHDQVEYAAWYKKVLDNWLENRWPNLTIRFLENLIKRLVGHPGIYEQMALSPASLITINTAGGIELVDTLKSTGNGAHATKMNIFDNSFNDILFFEDYIRRCFPQKYLCQTCKNCSVSDICVGGYIPHRYSESNEFENPSVYCSDLKALIEITASELKR